MPQPIQSPSSKSSLINDASLASKQIFTQQVTSVLQHSATSFLKRRVSQKIHEELSKLPHDVLVQSNVDMLISGLAPSVLEITEQDVADSEVFAKRVGCQWEKVLRRKGYTEFADVVLELVQKDKVLEGATNEETTVQNSDSSEKDGEQTADNFPDKFLTIDAALNSIQRYEPDCDGTGSPLKSLPKLSDVDSNGISTARKAIQQIDRLMENFDSETLRACYGYDWDAINEAVRRNRKRLYMFQRIDGPSNDDYEIVPKSLENFDEAGVDTLHQTEADAVDDDFLISTNTHTATILRRKRKREEKMQLKLNGSNNDAQVLQGRPPSAVGETQWAWQDVLDAIPTAQQQKLIRDYIHDPSAMDEDQSSIVCGSLRKFGYTHLWEETNTMHQIDPQSSFELQKGAIRRAIKERIGPRTLMASDKRSEVNEEVDGKKIRSKTKWTHSSEACDEENPRQWLESDLGDCTIEITDADNDDDTAVQRKRILTFRSIELALQF